MTERSVNALVGKRAAFHLFHLSGSLVTLIFFGLTAVGSCDSKEEAIGGHDLELVETSEHTMRVPEANMTLSAWIILGVPSQRNMFENQSRKSC